MAIRRVFYIDSDNKIKFHDFEILWVSGLSNQQKQKNVEELHKQISYFFGISEDRILEVSTKSQKAIGRMLSTFNLKMQINGKVYPIECIYQSSKVFKSLIGSYQIKDVLYMSPQKAKKRVSYEDHSNLCAFNYFGKEFLVRPKYLFFDWLYINAVQQKKDLVGEVSKFKYFTDIEFNPEKSISCQARTLVLYLWLIKNNKLADYIKNPYKFYKK